MFCDFVIEVPAIYALYYFPHQSSKLFKHRQKKTKKIQEQNKTNKLISENKQLKTEQIKMYCILLIFSTKGK